MDRHGGRQGRRHPLIALGLALLAFLTCTAQAQPVQVVYVSDPPLTFVDAAETAQSYVIGFSGSADRPLPPGDPHRVMMMRSANGTAYRCYIPEPAAVGSAADSSRVSTAAEGSLLPQKTPTELLEALADHCYYRIEDWWTYELCYGKQLRQYHKEGAATDTQYLLGAWAATGQAQGEADEVQVHPSDVSGATQYVAHWYTGGDTCELTGQPRQAEVRFTCGGGTDTLLMSVREPSSCTYVVTVATPRLCKHAAFQQQPTPASLIQCHALGLDGGAGSCSAGGGQQTAAEAAAGTAAVMDADDAEAVADTAVVPPDNASLLAEAAGEEDAYDDYDAEEEEEEAEVELARQAQQAQQAQSADADADDPCADEDEEEAEEVVPPPPPPQQQQQAQQQQAAEADPDDDDPYE